jgi:uncharacterized zinc-type alcohol dehydrogenase-like protein
MKQVSAYGVTGAEASVAPLKIDRRDLGPTDIQMEILYCGICHSDIHQARNEWGNSIYPMVPGHEIVGKVTAVGSDVRSFKAGDIAGVGCLVDSCRECAYCKEGDEQLCSNGSVGTYNSKDKNGQPTYGGYSKHLVVDEAFTLRIPDNLDLKAVAPLLCAGITTYSPLKRWNVRRGQQVAVIGLGGLGHMAVKLAAAMGAEVTVLSTSDNKEADARKLGATGFVNTRAEDAASKLRGKFDFILNTVSAPNSYDLALSYLKSKGTMVVVGAPPEPTQVAGFSLIMGNKNLAGSLIGGIKETQEMLDFCSEHNIVSEVEMVSVSQINEAYERILKSDVKYRFVIDMKSLD